MIVPVHVDMRYRWCYSANRWRCEITAIPLQISEIARQAGVSIRTVRFYEEKGLLTPSACTSGGIRLYSPHDVNRLIFIRRLTILGLSLDEIRLCLGELPENSDRKLRVEHTLKLLGMQKQRLADQRTRLAQLESDIDDSVAKVSRCLNCGAQQCPEQCSSYASML